MYCWCQRSLWLQLQINQITLISATETKHLIYVSFAHYNSKQSHTGATLTTISRWAVASRSARSCCVVSFTNYNNLLRGYWFLGALAKNLSDFVSLSWKPENSYCYNVQGTFCSYPFGPLDNNDDNLEYIKEMVEWPW